MTHKNDHSTMDSYIVIYLKLILKVSNHHSSNKQILWRKKIIEIYEKLQVFHSIFNYHDLEWDQYECLLPVRIVYY